MPDPLEYEETSHTPDTSEEPTNLPRAGTEVSITRLYQQIDVQLPSLLGSVQELADRHPDLAFKVLDDITRQGEHRRILEEAVVRGDDKRASRAQVMTWDVLPCSIARDNCRNASRATSRRSRDGHACSCTDYWIEHRGTRGHST